MQTYLFPPRALVVAFLACCALAQPVPAADVIKVPLAAAEWPEFRGPDGQGHATQRGLPLTWSETENIVWKAPVAGLGWSSPVIQGEQIWLTTATDDGHSLRAVCLVRDSGQIVHDIEVFHPEDPGKMHKKNSWASPTPILDGDRVYVHFGTNGTACLTTAGKIVWKNNDLAYSMVHGCGGSPVLVDDLLVLSCDGGDVQYVVALDKRTGKIRWKTERDGLITPKHFAFSTPLALQVKGTEEVISPGADEVISYEVKTGKPLWRVRYKGGYSVVPRPVFAKGLVFLSSGYDSPTLYAIRPDGEGDITESHVAWTLKKGAPHNPSPLAIGDDLYLVSDKGIGTCLDAATGEVHWQERIGGNFSASPLAADGRIYLLDEDGVTTVIAPGHTYQELAKNTLEGRTLASIAVAGRALYLRTDSHLYRIEAKQ